jgi:hypothetical protein
MQRQDGSLFPGEQFAVRLHTDDAVMVNSNLANPIPAWESALSGVANRLTEFRV